MPKIGTKWTPDMIDELKVRLAAGESVSQIAGGMIMTLKVGHMTRNMVSGIKWRLGLCTPKKIVLEAKGDVVKTRPRPRQRPPAQARKRSRVNEMKSAATTQWASDPKRMTAPQLPADGVHGAPGMRWITIDDLNDSVCHWPVWPDTRRPWDLGAVRYCGAEAEKGMPYCPCHCEVAYAPTGRLNEHRIPLG